MKSRICKYNMKLTGNIVEVERSRQTVFNKVSIEKRTTWSRQIFWMLLIKFATFTSFFLFLSIHLIFIERILLDVFDWISFTLCDFIAKERTRKKKIEDIADSDKICIKFKSRLPNKLKLLQLFHYFSKLKENNKYKQLQFINFYVRYGAICSFLLWFYWFFFVLVLALHYDGIISCETFITISNA